MTITEGDVDEIQALADQCVMCGLCLPHCPTFRLTRSEGESPRGRLSLMAALSRGALPASENLAGHIQRCLDCGSCERVCPSKVPYSQLLAQTRRQLDPADQSQTSAWQHQLLTSPKGIRQLGRIADGLRFTGLSKLAASLNPVAAIGQFAATPPKWAPHYPSKTKQTEQAGLFLGCAQQLFDADALRHTIGLLTSMGVSVHVPPTQTCCGALDRYRSDQQRADQMLRSNQNAFAGAATPVLLHTGSGCLSHLRKQPGLPPVAEICAWLLERQKRWESALRPLPLRIALHTPCTHRNAPTGTGAATALLAVIADLAVVPITEGFGCCGAAGNYMLAQPTVASGLRAPLLAWLKDEQIDCVATTNIGCALHLQAGMRALGRELSVVHPVSLLHRALDLNTLRNDQSIT